MHGQLTAAFVCLLVLDGWGVSVDGPGNAISLADTPNLDRFFSIYPHTLLAASGIAVGLPEGQMGNSEVGHLNLGAGRVVHQDLTRINLEVENGSFFENNELIKALNHAKGNDAAVHLIGLLSDGGVHSDISHLKALIMMAKQNHCHNVFLHAILDGRDVSPTSGVKYLEEILTFMHKEKIGELATISGRFYAMDRDSRWSRTKQAYDAIVYGEGPLSLNPLTVVEESYEQGITDEFFIPTVISNKQESRIHPTDSIVFFNFRPDRARQLTRALTFKNFAKFDRGPEPPLPYFVSMTEYDAKFFSNIAYPPEILKNVLASVLSMAGKTQLHIAETEKYAHVTFFFNGGIEGIYPGEIRKLIPSPTDVPTYDLKPEMSARQVTDELCRLLEERHFDFIIVNLANCDMVGHTGNLDAAKKAVETVDECVGRIVNKVTEQRGVCLITADHGNAESMIDAMGGPNTAHTTDYVPLIITASIKLNSECALGDVAPLILELLGIPIPSEMTGGCLNRS